MLSKSTVFTALTKETQILIEQIFDVIIQDFIISDPTSFEKVFLDFINLYAGNWPAYQKCQTGYHNLNHAIEVALVSTRMAAGYNIVERDNKFDSTHLLIVITASLFHDSGYLKDKDDTDGVGGKYTFTHVPRSIAIVSDYLKAEHWDDQLIDLVGNIISNTEFSISPDLSKFKGNNEKNLANIVGTADLIAQMADVNYMEHIRLLFEEFQEAYKFHGPKYLADHNITTYNSAGELINNTVQFYKDYVLPRFELMGRKDKYLISFFGEGRNPYLENITANISGKFMDRDVQWRRIGDVLQGLGVISHDQINDALAILQNFHKKKPAPVTKTVPFRTKFLSWIDGKNSHKNMGDVLLEINAVDPSLLRRGLLDQIFPPALLNKLGAPEIVFLLRTSVMLQNISKDQWVFEQILVMANELLPCEASSILLVNPDKREMLVAVSTALKKEFYLGRTIPLDKGLSGWVFLQDQPAIVDNIEKDHRFDIEIDKRVNFEPHCILTVPLHVNGNPIGVMEFFNKKDCNFNDYDVSTMTLLANVIATSLNSALTLE